MIDLVLPSFPGDNMNELLQDAIQYRREIKHTTNIMQVEQQEKLKHFAQAFYWLTQIVIRNPKLKNIKYLPQKWKNIVYIWQRITQNKSIKQKGCPYSLMLNDDRINMLILPFNFILQTNAMKSEKRSQVQSRFSKIFLYITGEVRPLNDNRTPQEILAELEQPIWENIQL
jgi:hypothetical protein